MCKATSVKYKPLIIGKSKSPRNFARLDLDNLGIVYKNDNKSWMTACFFTEWLDALNNNMISQQRRILLVLDNAPVHKIQKNFSNINLQFLPPGTTSKTQPLDQGIIRSFKAQYKKGFYVGSLLMTKKIATIMKQSKNISYMMLSRYLKKHGTVLQILR